MKNNFELSICMLLKESVQMIESVMVSIKNAFVGINYEILVVDNGMDQAALAELHTHGATVLDGRHLAFDRARKLYIDRANGKWILILDADERITKEGVAVLLNAIKHEENLAYTLPVLTYIGSGKWASFYALRLFRNGHGIRYEDREMHAGLQLQDGTPLYPCAQKIYAPIHHFDCLMGNGLVKRRRNMEKLENAIAESPDDGTMWMYLGLEYVALKQYDLAEETYKKALLLRPDSLYTKKFHMELLLHLGRYDEASDLANLLLEKNRYVDVCYYTLSHCADAHDDFNSAISYLTKALCYEPYQADICISLALLYSQKNAEKAIRYFHKAILLNPLLFSPKIYVSGDEVSIYRLQTKMPESFDNIYLAFENLYAQEGDRSMATFMRSQGERLLCYLNEGKKEFLSTNELTLI